MRVIFDARMVSYQYTGLGRFSGEILFELLKLAQLRGDKYLIVLWSKNLEKNKYIKKIEDFRDSGICEILYVDCKPVGISQHIMLSKFLTKAYGDIYIHPHFDLPLFAKIPSICFIHDLFPTKVKGYMVRNAFLKKIYFRLMLRIVASKAKYIYAVSETTKKDFLQEVGLEFADKVGVCLEGPIIRKSSTHINKKLRKNNFLLYAGDRRPHKNIKKIIDLYIALKNESYMGDLLIVGSQKNYDFDVENYISKIRGVYILGNVDDSELLDLYLQMDALIFLSKYEGFGLPVVECGLLGKKIIVSDGGALQEVSPGWAFVLPSGADVSKQAGNIFRYLESPLITDPHYGDSYDWGKVALSVRNKFEKILGV